MLSQSSETCNRFKIINRLVVLSEKIADVVTHVENTNDLAPCTNDLEGNPLHSLIISLAIP